MAFKLLERKATAWGIALFLFIVAADCILFSAVLENRGAVRYNLEKILENQSAIEENQAAIQANQQEIRNAMGLSFDLHARIENKMDSLLVQLEERPGTR